MKILHVTSDNKPGGIQRAFSAYLDALGDLPEFDNSCFMPTKLASDNSYANTCFIKMSPLQKMLIRRAPYLPISALQKQSFTLGLVHNGFMCASIRKYCDIIIGICHNDKPEQFMGSHHLICLTPNAVKKAKNIGRNSDTIHLLPHYFEPRAEAEMPSNKGRASQLKTVGAAGRFVEKKGFQSFIDAAADVRSEYPEIKFLLAGDGPLSKHLHQYAENKGNPIRFIGWTDINKFASSLDVFCLPSLDEPYGYVLPEVMQYGVAIVTSKTNGPMWICQGDENALFFEPADSHQIASHIKMLIRNPNKLGEYQTKAKNTLAEERFSQNAFIKNLLSIILNITHQS